MLTYDLTEVDGPIYQALYEYIKQDILSGKLGIKEKMPSKRTLAKNLGLSTITVENAYDQLIGEGYMYSIPKRGYYVSDIAKLEKIPVLPRKKVRIDVPVKEEVLFDFSSNRTDGSIFPFSVWAKVMRETISLRENDLLTMSPAEGVYELRKAISEHLSSFRGMDVDPGQVIVGAGTEYLYSMIVQLLGNDKIYCIENPGYKKLLQIYNKNTATCKYANMDDKGILIEDLIDAGADVAHVSPTHHFPTGLMMPISRRYELLAWANEKPGRYIIEDDYDSEFRTVGRPIPSLQSIDACGKVIYMNTFSKSLTSTIRISYMVLPEELANLFYKELGFYSCTVSTFEQYALASFINQGYFEKHINRMRLHYGKKRLRILELIERNLPKEKYKVIESDSGLHFILELKTEVSDLDVKEEMRKRKMKIATISDYEIEQKNERNHKFILNYSSIDMDGLENALKALYKVARLE